MIKKSISLIGILIFYLKTWASYQEGVQAFMLNDYSTAKFLFEKAIENEDHPEESYIYITLIESLQGQDQKKIAAFSSFYNLSASPDPYVYALAFSGNLFGIYNKQEPEALKLLQKIQANPKSSGSTKAIADFMLGYHYYYANNSKKARFHFNQMEAIAQWQVLGEFDNTSGGGFTKDHQAISCPSATCTFKNKSNADVQWFSIPALNFNGWLDFDYHVVTDDAIVYSQTFINNPIAQDVFVRIGVSGSIKCWIDDQLILSESEERNIHSDVYTRKVFLPQGKHRIVLQVGRSLINDCSAMVRLTDVSGKVIKGITASSIPYEYIKNSVLEVQEIEHTAEYFFREKMQTDPTDFLTKIMLFHVYLLNDKTHEAREIITDLQKIAPNNLYILTQSLNIYQREKNQVESTRIQEKIKSQHPNSIFALSALIQENLNNTKYDEAAQNIDRMKKIYGNSLTTDLFKISLLSKKASYDELIKEVNRLYIKYPENSSVVSTKYLIETAVNKNSNTATKILENYLENNYNHSFTEQVAENYLSQNKTEKAYGLYKGIIAQNTVSVGTHIRLTKLYFSNQQYNQALTHIEEAIRLAPYVSSYWDTKGRIYHSMNNLAKAKESLQRSVYLSPTNYAARSSLRLLEGKKDLFDYFEKNNVDSMFQNAPGAAQYPEDHSVILLNDEQRIFYQEGASETRGEILIKVFNQSGIDAWKEYTIGYNPYSQNIRIEKAEIFKKDGSKSKAEQNNDHMVFTGLEVGDAIYIVYRIENHVYGKLSQHFNDQFHFNYFFPSLLSRYSVLLPKEKEIQHHLSDQNVSYDRKEIEQMTLHTWHSKNQAAISPELGMPALADVSKTLEITSIKDWNFVVDWYADLSTGRAKADFDVKKLVQELFKDEKKLSDLEKAKIIYEYIVRNITYSNVDFLHGAYVPQKASTTIHTKMGDCKDVSTLFVTLAREIGLKANLVLVDTRDNGEKDMILPSIRFNHCIVELTIDQNVYYIELTNQKSSFHTVSSLLNQSLILPIPPDGAKNQIFTIQKLRSTSHIPNGSYRTSTVRFNGNDLIVQKVSIKTAQDASAMRSTYADIGEEKQKKYMLESISADYASPVQVQEVKFEDLHTLRDSITYTYSYTVQNHLKDLSSMKLLSLPWVHTYTFNEYFSNESRKYPLLLWTLIDTEEESETLNIEIPKGYQVLEIPKNEQLQCNNARFSIEYNLQGSNLRIEKKFKMLKDIVNTEEYPQAKAFFARVQEIHQQQLGFKKVNEPK